MYKQVIVIRKDLKLEKGKLSVQVAHASVENLLKIGCDSKKVKEWRKEGMKKSVLSVETEEELLKIYNKAKVLGLESSLIRDAGLTVLEPGTITCFSIGPDKEELIDKITGDLKLL